MAGEWNWTTTEADRQESVRQSVMRQKLAKIEAEYDREVQRQRQAMERYVELVNIDGVDVYMKPASTLWGPPQPQYYRQLPPETRYQVAREVGLFTPKNPAPQYAKFLGEAVRYPLELLTRPRDTAIRSAQQFAQGDVLGGLGHAVAAPVSTLVPEVAAGRYGDPDDWREQARRNGISEANIMALDWGTDPMTYLGPGLLSKARGATGSLARAANNLRYGPGAMTELVDPSGAVIRRLMNSPATTSTRRRPPYVPSGLMYQP